MNNLIVPVQPLILTQAGQLPTIPTPATIMPTDPRFNKQSDLMVGQLAYNVTDDKWYYRSYSAINNLMSSTELNVGNVEEWRSDKIYYAGNVYVSYANPNSTDVQFQTAALYKCLITTSAGQSPETHSNKWEYLGTSVSTDSLQIESAKIIVEDLEELKSISVRNDKDSVIVKSELAIYKFDSAQMSNDAEFVRPNDVLTTVAGRWAKESWISTSNLSAILTPEMNGAELYLPIGSSIVVTYGNGNFIIKGEGQYNFIEPSIITRIGSGITPSDFNIKLLSTGHEIQNLSNTFPQRKYLRFLGNVTLLDNAITNTTTVTVDVPEQLQADWDQTVDTAYDYIKNKPTSLTDFNNDLDLSGYITRTGENLDEFVPELNDWYLPSLNELTQVYLNLKAQSIGDFPTEAGTEYWTSTEVGPGGSNNYFINFYNGTTLNTGKNTDSKRFRPVRHFISNAPYSIGDRGPGNGWIYYIEGTTIYEVASAEHEYTGVWSNITTGATGATDTAIGTGLTNSLAIVAQSGHTTSAANTSLNFSILGAFNLVVEDSLGNIVKTEFEYLQGEDGITPHIDPTTKNWFIGDTDTGILAEGVAGQDGQDGAPGIDGLNGQDGQDGSPGAQGPQGPQGVAGPVGPAGLIWQGLWDAETDYVEDDAVGFNGASWFCILALLGDPFNTDPSVDTTHWALLAAQGADGPQGPQGIQGIQGIQGLQGIQGPQGAQGEQGIAGANGTNGIDGEDGQEVQLQKSSTHIQWKYLNEISWTDLVALTELKGDTGAAGTAGEDGREIQLQTTATHIQWQYVDNIVWNDLIAIDLLKGEKGDNGGLLHEQAIVFPDPSLYTEGDEYWDALSLRLYKIYDNNGTNEWVQAVTNAVILGGEGGGSDGLTPYIFNGNWWIGDTDTGVQAEGQDGTNGTNGTNGVTPHIGINGNWYTGVTDTGVKAAGLDGLTTSVNNITQVGGNISLTTDNIPDTATNRLVTDTQINTWDAKSNLALGETISTAYRGDRGKTAYDHSQSAHAPANAQANVPTNLSIPFRTATSNLINSSTGDSELGGDTIALQASDGVYAGLLSAADKNKLDTVQSMATKIFWSGTQAAYDAVTPKDANTIYFVEEV